MQVEWPPFPAEVGMLDHPATEEDLAAGRAAFVIRDDTGQLRGRPLRMGMSRLGFVTGGDEPQLGVAVQAEVEGDRCAVAVLHSDGNFSVCTPAEFKSAPRCLVLFDKPGYTLDSVEHDWMPWTQRTQHFKMARRDDVLAVQWKEGPILFIRYATGNVVADEIRLIDHPRRAELNRCTALFEVSLFDLDETLDEINTLIDTQDELQRATEGFLYLEWNGHLSANGE